VASLLGDLVYERAYYHGCRCDGGWSPTDESFRLTEKLTPGASEVVALAGGLSSFEEAASLSLPKLAGLRVSPSTVERTVMRVGGDLHERRTEGETFGDTDPWDWHADADGQRCGYVSLDATGVRQQADDGGKKEARMVLVGEVFNPTPTHQKKTQRIWDARYVCGLMSLEELGRQLRHEALAVGLRQADVVIGLTDGGAGLEDCLMDGVFAGLGPSIEFILDFYHASEHVHEFLRVWIPQDEALRKKQAEAWCHQLKHEGGEALLTELAAVDLSAASPAAVESHRLLCGYFRRNLHRMDYPRYVSRGWQIGSGTIESACKTVVNARLDQTGMRWGELGTDAMGHLRALMKSQRTAWEHYWSPTQSSA
jgi:hypothetical protein